MRASNLYLLSEVFCKAEKMIIISFYKQRIRLLFVQVDPEIQFLPWIPIQLSQISLFHPKFQL